MKHLLQILLLLWVGSVAGQTWTGNVSSDWENPNNWSGNTLPSNGDDIIIDADDYTNAPVISANSSFDPNSITIRDGGLLTRTAGNLDISEDLNIDNGTFTSSGGNIDIGDDILMDGGTLNYSGGNMDVDEIEIDNSSVANLSGGSITMTGDLDANSNSTFNLSTTITQTSGDEDFNIGTGATFNILTGANITGFNDVDFDGAGNGTYNQTGGIVSIDDDFKIQDGDNNTVNVSGGVLIVGDDFEIETDGNTIVFSGDADVDVGDNFEFTNGADSNDVQVTDDASLDVVDDILFDDGSNNDFVIDGNGSVNAGGTDDINQFDVSEGGTANIGGTVLPVDLIEFIGLASNNQVNLSWKTASEKNNDRFEILRSQDGEQFKIISQMRGAGDSNEILSYSFSDRTPPVGINYYKLVQYDFDGTYDELGIISVLYLDGSSSMNQIEISPNPSSGRFSLNLPFESKDLEFRIINMAGKEVHRDFLRSESEHVVSVPSGLYILEVTVDDKTMRSRFSIR